MQIRQNIQSPTETIVTVVLDAQNLEPIKNNVLRSFQSQVSLPGFRPGKAPLALVEKSIDQSKLQTNFLEEAINQSYPQAVKAENLRPVDRPEISIKKFVPFNMLEYDAKVTVISGVKLPDYSRIRKHKPAVKVTDDDISAVLESLRERAAKKEDVERPGQKSDQIWIDFQGTDENDKPVKGADGKDYTLVLGSSTFIPGFEDNLVGLSAGQSKSFTLTFPMDYGLKALAGKKVRFLVNVKKVQAVTLPKLDDKFAATVGPFKALADLKRDIKKQLTIEKQRQADIEYESDLVREISSKTKFVIPDVLINDQVERMMQELEQNLSYKGQTLQEYFEIIGVDEDKYRQGELKQKAQERVRASLVLAEIAEKEKIFVTPEELEVRMGLLKGKYTDRDMRIELDKPETKQDIAARLLSEKTVAHIVQTVSSR